MAWGRITQEELLQSEIYIREDERRRMLQDLVKAEATLSAAEEEIGRLQGVVEELRKKTKEYQVQAKYVGGEN